MSVDLLDLDADDWSRLDRLLDEALGLAGAAQARFIERLESQSPADATNLRRLLKAATTEGPLERPALADVEESRLAVGTSVGPWRIDGVIGAGGMGEVYAASRDDEAYQQRVALKVLRHGIATTDAAARFRAERQCLALLEHPNITRLIDGGVLPDGRPYLAMTHVEGQPLDEWYRSTDAPVEVRLQLFLQIADAVHYAHQRLIVHRDLKPTNILVSADGQPVLLDFGIAKLLDQETEDGRTQETRAFTPGWAAPEQIAGRRATTATDIYGLGLLLFLLLTGRRAFEAATAATEAPAPSARADEPALVRRLRGDLDAIVRCALAVDPEARYGSVSAFADDVLRHLNDEPVRAPGASRSARVAKAVRRHRWPVALAATVVLALSGYAGTVTLQARELRAKEAARRRSADRADRVAGFLVDLLASGDPRRGEVSVAELVDDGARRLQSELRDLPLVRRAVAVALAEAQLALGQHEAAGILTSNALEAFEAQPPTALEDQVTHGRALLLLSRVRFRQGKLQEGEALARSAQQAANLVADGGRLTADVREWRGTLAHERFDFKVALSHYDVAFQIRSGLLGATAPDAIRVALRISEMHANLRDSVPSQQWRDTAAAALGRSDAPPRELVEGYLLMAYLVEGDAAKDMWRERAIEALVGVYGEHHPEVADALNDYGLSLETRDPERAVAYLARALDVTEAHYGEKTPRVVKARLNLGAVLREAGEIKRAAPLLERALVIGREVYPPTSRQLAYPLTHLSQLRRRQGRLEEAERLAVELVALLDRHPNMVFHQGVSHYRLAQILVDQGRVGDAEAHLQAAVTALGPKTEPPFAEATLAWATARSTLERPLDGDLLEAIDVAVASTKTASVTRHRLAQLRAQAPASTDR